MPMDSIFGIHRVRYGTILLKNSYFLHSTSTCCGEKEPMKWTLGVPVSPHVCMGDTIMTMQPMLPISIRVRHAQPAHELSDHQAGFEQLKRSICIANAHAALMRRTPVKEGDQHSNANIISLRCLNGGSH